MKTARSTRKVQLAIVMSVREQDVVQPLRIAKTNDRSFVIAALKENHIGGNVMRRVRALKPGEAVQLRWGSELDVIARPDNTHTANVIARFKMAPRGSVAF